MDRGYDLGNRKSVFETDTSTRPRRLICPGGHSIFGRSYAEVYQIMRSHGLTKREATILAHSIYDGDSDSEMMERYNLTRSAYDELYQSSIEKYKVSGGDEYWQQDDDVESLGTYGMTGIEAEVLAECMKFGCRNGSDREYSRRLREHYERFMENHNETSDYERAVQMRHGSSEKVEMTMKEFERILVSAVRKYLDGGGENVWTERQNQRWDETWSRYYR